MNKALNFIKLPKPRDATQQEAISTDKMSELINGNFKLLFDAILELESAIAAIQTEDTA